MKRFLAAIAAASGVIASGCSTAPDDKEPAVRTEIIRPAVPASARQPCPAPVTLPDRDVTEAEATGFWGRDRASLRQCESRRAAAIAAIDGTTP